MGKNADEWLVTKHSCILSKLTVSEATLSSWNYGIKYCQVQQCDTLFFSRYFFVTGFVQSYWSSMLHYKFCIHDVLISQKILRLLSSLFVEKT